MCVCVCVCARACVWCVSLCFEYMSPYCPAHDEWLIMELCTYVGYHDANNVSNFGGDPVTQFDKEKRKVKFKKHFTVLSRLFYGHGAP